jgi:hypothetical protein
MSLHKEISFELEICMKESDLQALLIRRVDPRYFSKRHAPKGEGHL